MTRSKKVFLLGLANGLKPKIIIELLEQSFIWSQRDFVFLTNSNEGVAVEYCLSRNIPVEIIRVSETYSHSIDVPANSLLISIGWSWKVRDDFLSLFTNSINCHGGLLPDYRGNNTYMHAYANLEDEYGVTIHYMTGKFDDGNIISQGKLKLYLSETPEVIHRRVCELSAYLLPDSIRLVEDGYEGYRQQGTARYFYKINKNEMDKLRRVNVERIRKGIVPSIAQHIEWKL